MNEDDLTALGRKLRDQASVMAGHDATDRADILAATLGATAGRAGWDETRLRKWSQSAYGAVWVGTDLNPGLDFKQVQNRLARARALAVKPRS